MADLVLINGEEEFLKERKALEEASSRLSDSVIRYRMPDDLPLYAEEAQLVPFLGQARVFVLFDVKEVPDLPSGDADLLVCVSAAKKKLSDRRATRVHVFPKLKTFADNNEVVRWILQEGDALNIDLSRVASALFVNSGKSLRKISSEIRKLAVLTPSGGIASPDDARAVMCFSAELTPRNIVDSICEGHPAKALTYYDKLQEGAEETGWVIAYLQRHTVQHLRLVTMSSAGESADSMARGLGVHPFVFRKVVRPRIGLWSASSLSRSADRLGELDVLHKSGGPARIGLEEEIVRLSEEARENVEKRNRGRG